MACPECPFRRQVHAPCAMRDVHCVTKEKRAPSLSLLVPCRRNPSLSSCLNTCPPAGGAKEFTVTLSHGLMVHTWRRQRQQANEAAWRTEPAAKAAADQLSAHVRPFLP